MSLFTDDILTYISEPSSSIPALLNNLNEDGEISGYLTNEAKSVAIMVQQGWRVRLHLNGPQNDSNIWVLILLLPHLSR